MRETIIEISRQRNLCQIKLTLTPDEIMQIMGAFSDLTQIVQEHLTRRQKWDIAMLRRERVRRFLTGIAAYRLARRMGKRIRDVAEAVADRYGLPVETIIARARSARSHVIRRYRRWRNAAIRRLVAEGTPYSVIVERFRLSKGRVAQIVREA